ncbi:MAG: DUF5067 domain-containing protein [Clostridiales bacterium]|nr:DUF5067 domain-containing protein [Clostridiales bacterium]
MKKLLCILLVILLLPVGGALASYDLTGYSDQQLADLASAIAAEQLARSRTSGQYLLQGTYDKATIGLKDIKVQQSGNDRLLILVFDFSHSSDDAEMFSFSASIKVFQDGIELDNAYFYDHPSSGNGLKQIKKGAVLEVTEGYKLTSGSPVEIEMNEIFNFGGRKPDAITLNLP